MAGRGTCKGCGADIAWGFNRASKRRIPMEPGRMEPDNVPAPNLAVSRDHLGALLVRPLKADETPWPNEWWGLAHFAVCPKRQARTKTRGENVVDLDRRRSTR